MTLRTVWHHSLFLLAVVLLGVQGCSRDDAEAYTKSGIALSKMGKAPEACEKYAEAVEINPRLVEAYVNWGLALHAMGKAPEACEKYAKAVEVNPRDAIAYSNWGAAKARRSRRSA